MRKIISSIYHNFLLTAIMFFCFFILLIKIFPVRGGVFKEPVLHGVVNEYEKISFNIKNVMSGDYQLYLENEYLNNFTFHNYFVKAYNEMLFRISANNNGLVYGKNKWLFTEEDVRTYIGSELSNINYNEYAENIKIIQDYCMNNGKSFIYIISPSKADTYEDLLLPKYRKMKSEKRNYIFLKKALQERDVCFIDAVEITNEMKKAGESPFHKNGVHWNELAAQKTLKEAFRIMEEKEDHDLPEINYTYEITDQPFGTDDDAYLLNNIYSKNPAETYYAVNVRERTDTGSEHGKICFWGTSFCEQLTTPYIRSNVFDKVTHYRYLQFGYTIQDKELIRFEINQDMEDNNIISNLLENDIIVFETNAPVLVQSHIDIAQYMAESINDISIVSTTENKQ